MALLALCALSACESSITDPDPLTRAGPRISVGEVSTCAIGSNESLWCWGQNDVFVEFGVLNTVLATRSTPGNTGIGGFVTLAVGHGNHMCGLTAAKVAKCWGRNSHGQIGANVPVAGGSTILQVGGGPWEQISVGRLTTCGVTTQFVASCWGANQRGEAGNPLRGILESATTPRPVEGLRAFKAIATGWLHSCGLTTSGDLFCWGDNGHGQLGIGIADTMVHRTPLAVQTTLKFEQITAGANYTCGIATDHSAFCWGLNATGALGDNTSVSRAVPTAVSGSLKFKNIVAGSGFGIGGGAPLPNALQGGAAHTCALSEAGAAYCWGWNASGQVGDGTLIDRLSPVAVSGGRVYTELGLGGAHSCGMLGNAIWCWGGNAFGQLGNGNTANSNVPVAVGAPFN